MQLSEVYVKLLELQYYNKPNASSEIKALCDSFQSIYDTIQGFSSKFDIDTAKGEQLDIIGAIVGQSRVIKKGYPKAYFGFTVAGDIARGFGDGEWRTDASATYSPTTLDDSLYRFYLKARIINNNVKAVMVSDDGKSLQDAYNYLFNGKAYIVDNQDMSISVFVSDFSQEDLDVLENENLLPTPMGVRIRPISEVETVDYFGWSNDPDAKGFGVGQWVDTLTIT